VLVRGHGGPVDATGWDPRDLEYARTETQAALIAWLWSLSCPVVNRPSADLWFRPNLSYAEWHAAFQRCGLPVSPLCYTNRIDAAREFAQRWHGRAIYLPFTSPSRYPISSARDWDELARLAARFPVCVTAPAERSVHATVVGESVVWGGCDGALDVGVLEPGLLRLADSLDLDFVQIEIALTADGLRCICATPHPLLERHPDGEQVLADELVRLLERGSRRMRPGPPELRRLACPQGPP
jgi:hypothetical protein